MGRIIIDSDERENQLYIRSGILAQLPSPYRQLHILERVKGYRKEMHSHSCYQLILVTSGTLEIITEKETLVMKKGQVAIIAPKALHELYSPDGYSQLGIDIFNQTDGRGLVTLLRKHFAEGIHMQFTTGSVSFDSTFREIYMQTDINTLKLVNKAESLVIDIIEQSQETNVDFSDRFMSIVAENGYDLSLEEISSRMNISVTHLERLVNKYFSCSAKALCQRIRLSKSCVLLENTNLPIKTISERFGFYDESHFVRAFKKHFSITPSQYRSNSVLQKRN